MASPRPRRCVCLVALPLLVVARSFACLPCGAASLRLCLFFLRPALAPFASASLPLLSPPAFRRILAAPCSFWLARRKEPRRASCLVPRLGLGVGFLGGCWVRRCRASPLFFSAPTLAGRSRRRPPAGSGLVSPLRRPPPPAVPARVPPASPLCGVGRGLPSAPVPGAFEQVE